MRGGGQRKLFLGSTVSNLLIEVKLGKMGGGAGRDGAEIGKEQMNAREGEERQR